MSEEFLEKISIANLEVKNGDFVTLSRVIEDNIICEHIMTFSGIEFERTKYADNAKAK